VSFVIFAAKTLFEAYEAAANFVGYAVGVILNYKLNAKWTFSYRSSASWALGRFLVVVGIAYLANLATVLLALEGLGIDGYVAQLLGVPPYAVTSYLLSRQFVFKTP
jgi:putative flippase GtrA